MTSTTDFAGNSKNTPLEYARMLFLGKDLYIEDIIGSGHATVYKARDSSKRLHALKVYFPRNPKRSIEREEEKSRFTREIERTSLLGSNHQNIISVEDSGWISFDLSDPKIKEMYKERFRGLPFGVQYMVMPFADGGNLRSPADVEMSRKQVLSKRQVLDVVCNASEALAYAHKLGVIHADVKPENILLFKRGRKIKVDGVVSDFGAARKKNPVDRSDRRIREMGTSDYFSPEQAKRVLEFIRDGERIDGELGHLDVWPSSDVYSLALTLYESFTKKDNPYTRIPFSESLKYRCQQIIKCPVVHMLKGTGSSRLDAILQKALHPDPKDRYQKMGHFLGELRKVQKEL